MCMSVVEASAYKFNQYALIPKKREPSTVWLETIGTRRLHPIENVNTFFITMCIIYLALFFSDHRRMI